MKGYIPCSVLIALEAKAGKPCGEIFDLFAGTSIGGIMACLLATGRSAADSIKFFNEDGPKIFGHHQFLGHNGIFRPYLHQHTNLINVSCHISEGIPPHNYRVFISRRY